MSWIYNKWDRKLIKIKERHKDIIERKVLAKRKGFEKNGWLKPGEIYEIYQRWGAHMLSA